MYNSCTKTRAGMLALAVVVAALRSDGSPVSNELRVTSCYATANYGVVTVAGLRSAVSNGCPWLSLSMCDGLGGDSVWPGGFQWRLDYAPIALHRFDSTKNYQRFSGAHFWRPVCYSNSFATAMEYQGPEFAPGDNTGYAIVSNVAVEAAYRVYKGFDKDGVFIYSDLYAPHWIVWTTNAGASYHSGWPWVNVPIGTNDTYTFSGMPIRWGVATLADFIRTEDDFALVPGLYGGMPAFYMALTETTEATTTAVISNGVAMGLCSASDFAPVAGRGATYPETGRTLAEALALCNLATMLHNAVSGDALTPVYGYTNAPFYRPVSNVMAVVRGAAASGYRLPTSEEYALSIAGDNRSRFPWGDGASYEWFYATNGLPVTETVLLDSKEIRDFYLKYELATTNSTANFYSRNGVRHVSPGRVSAVRSQYREWSVPAVNTNGNPVVWKMCGMSGAMYFGDSTSDGAWGVGVKQVHDLSGNVSEMAWPPVQRSWGSVRVCLLGGSPTMDAGYARSDRRAWCSAEVGRDTVGFRFARNKVEVAR